MPAAVAVRADAWSYPYEPHERQQAFHRCTAEEVLYGGAAGGGKSDALLAAGVQMCLMVPGAKVILFRRTFPELEQEIIPRMEERLHGVARYNSQKHVFTFPNGSTFRLGYLQRDRDVTRYQGPEYQLILWDELTHFTRKQYVYMRSRLRAAGKVAERMDELGWKCRMMGATNPGGEGHGWVKAMFYDPSIGLPRDSLFLGGITEEQVEEGVQPLVLAFIPAKATDNPHLDQDAYHRKLSALDPMMARALRDGDWDILEGVRFPQFRAYRHVIRPDQLPLPLVGYPRAVAVDWGLSSPFCALWGALIPEWDTVVVYRELYAKNLTAEQQAKLILEAEAAGERIIGRPIPIALDPACWIRPHSNAEKSLDPDAPAKGSIAWWYRKILGTQVRKANNDRLGGWQLVDYHLNTRDDDDPTALPRLLIYDNCKNLIRTLPEQQRSNTNPNDVDTHGEDHASDCLRYLLMQLVGGGHDRTARDTGIDAFQAASVLDARDRAYDLNLTAPVAPGPAEVTRRAARRVPYSANRRTGGYTDS